MNPRWMRKRPIVFRRKVVIEDKVTGDLTEAGSPEVWTLYGQFVVGSERQINMAAAGDSPRADGRCTFFAADVAGREPQVGDEITEVNGVTCAWMVTDVQHKADFNHVIVKFARPEATLK